jgi:hypothetical protein
MSLYVVLGPESGLAGENGDARPFGIVGGSCIFELEFGAPGSVRLKLVDQVGFREDPPSIGSLPNSAPASDEGERLLNMADGDES